MTQAAIEWDLQALVQEARAAACIPGLAVAVVANGELVLQNAFGLRDAARGLPATTDTQFAICSLTKSVTATGLAMLVEHGELDWDRPVGELMPDFRLQDPLASREATLRDLLSHRTGLPRHDWLWIPGERSHEEMFAVLDRLPPNREFRSVFQYQNLMYMVAGMVAERITGMRWEDFTRRHLLEPLGMVGCSFSAEQLRRAAAFSEPHRVTGASAQVLPMRPITATPAGGISASIDAMARYLRFHLDSGAAGPRRLLSAPIARLLHSSQMFVRTAEYAELADIYYGFGFEVTHYRSERLVQHAGGWVGWGSLLAMLPERRTGVVILTNCGYSPALEILSFMIFDRICGFPPADWLARRTAKIEEGRRQHAASRAARSPQLPPEFSAARIAREYTGVFVHPAYGRVTIEEHGSALRWLGLGIDSQLEHKGGNTFAFPEGDEEATDDYVELNGARIVFQPDPADRIDRLAVPLEPRLPDAKFHREG